MSHLEIIRGILRAEDALGVDLMICFYGDGSGRVRDVALEVDAFKFDSPLELEDWLREPRRVEYDVSGEPVAKAGSR